MKLQRKHSRLQAALSDAWAIVIGLREQLKASEDELRQTLSSAGHSAPAHHPSRGQEPSGRIRIHGVRMFPLARDVFIVQPGQVSPFQRALRWLRRRFARDGGLLARRLEGYRS